MRSSHTDKVEYETYETTEDHKNFHKELGEDKPNLKRGSSKGLVWGWRTLTSVLLLACLVILIYQIGKHDQHHRAQEEVSQSLKNSTSTVVMPNPTQPTGSITRTEPIGCEGWIMIQRRGQYSNPADFFSSKLWDDYEKGFGETTKEYWLGLETISNMTGIGTWELLVELEDFQNKTYIALYHSFKVHPSPLYKLSISGYDSDTSSLKDSLSVQNGFAFTTKDRDNDIYGTNCASKFLGAWWYSKCHSSNLNGFNYNRGDLPHNPDYYAKGIIWMNEGNVAEQDHYFSWPKAEMKIRRKGC